MTAINLLKSFKHLEDKLSKLSLCELILNLRNYGYIEKTKFSIIKGFGAIMYTFN